MSTLPFNRQDRDRLVPNVVSEKISDVVSRTRFARLLSGVLVALATALAVMLIAIGLDWLFVLFEPAQRAQLTLVALTAMGLLAAVCFAVVAFRGVSTLEAARQIDEQIPALQERWMSVTEFSASKASRDVRGSETFIRKVAEEAAQMETIVEPNNIRVGKDLIFASGGLAAIAGLWIVAFYCDPGQTAVLVQRFFLPGANVSLTQIRSESGDMVQPRGSNLKLEAVATGRVRQKAELIIRKIDGTEETNKLDILKGDTPRFTFSIKDLQADFSYRFRSGDGQTVWHTVRIAERPTIKLADFKIVAPEYAKLPEFHQDGLPKSVRALQGSRLFIDVESSLPLKSLILQGEDKVDRALARLEPAKYHFEMNLNETFVFRPVLESTDGLTNTQPPRCEVIVYRDEAPSVKVADPVNEVALRPEDTVTIKFEANDDLGVSKAELVVFDPSKDGNQVLKTIPIPLGEQKGKTSVKGETELNLDEFDLKQGQQLAYLVRVYDTKDEASGKQKRRPSQMSPADQAVAKQDGVDQAIANNDAKPRDNSPIQTDPSNKASQKENQSMSANDAAAAKGDQQSNSKEASSQQKDSPQKDGQKVENKDGKQTESSDRLVKKDQQKGDPTEGDELPESTQLTKGENEGTITKSSKTNEKEKAGDKLADDSQPGDAQSDGKQSESKELLANDDSQESQSNSGETQNTNAQMSKSAQNDSPDNSVPDENTGKPRPENKMAMRELDTPTGQSTSSSRRIIKIDEWADSYASQVLEKLQLEINPVLEEIRVSLTSAKDTLKPLQKQLKTAKDWKPADGVTVRKGDDFLNKAEGRVEYLVRKTAGNPYQFIGLQLQDIAQQHITPAREQLRDVTLLDQSLKPEDLAGSAAHVVRAIELLEKLTRQYEAVKLDQKLADLAVNIKKMHQLFLEDTFELLNSEKPELNPKDRAMMEQEFSEEYLAKLKKFLEKRLEIQAELAKLLSQDPRLLQRYMARIRAESTTLRDQLTLLATRQRELADEVKEGLPPADKPNGKLELKNRVTKRTESAAKIAEETAQMIDNFLVWMPLDQDSEKGVLAKFKGMGQKMTGLANEFAEEAKNEQSAESLDKGNALYQDLLEWQRTLPDLLDLPGDGKMQLHVANRLDEVQKLVTDVSGWVMKELVMDRGDHHLAAEVDQHRITVDTMNLNSKLKSIEAQSRGMTEELGNEAKAFLGMLDEELLPELEEAQLAFESNQLTEAVGHQAAAVEQFAKAEKKLDELMAGMIKYLDDQPFDEAPEFPDDLEPDTLDQLLAMLDEEEQAIEALGLGERGSNLSTETDWMRRGSGSGFGGRGRGRGRSRGGMAAQRNQSEMSAKQAELLRKRMEEALKKLKDPGDRNQTAGKEERKWDTLGSKLEDHLRQSRGNMAPEQYRKAIEQYFESLTGKSRNPAKGD